MRLAPVALYAVALAAPLGCSSPVPATPDVAWVLNLNGGGANCNLSNSVGKVGDVNETSIQQRVTDGMTGAMVSCTVVASGSSFQVNASASQNGYSLVLNIPKIDNGNLMATPAVGSLSYESAATAVPYSTDPTKPCNFYFINPSASGNGMGVSAGKIWGVFSCDGITNGSANPPSTCAVGVSYFAFENCGTAAQ